MKIELDAERPENFRVEWDGQYDIFSYLEFVCSVPSPMFLVTTRKGILHQLSRAAILR